MDRIQTFWYTHRLAVLAAVAIAITLTGLLVQTLKQPTLTEAQSDKPDGDSEITVDIEGAVAVPGVRRLPRGSLVEDALVAAGGITEQADADRMAKQLNRAERLKDNQKIYIPAQGEAGQSDQSESPETGEKVNLNEATKAQLEALPGIGPSTAQKIIDQREQQGSFSSVEDLQQVPGIGPSKYEQLKDLVTV